jgi:hypothetical protein
LILVVSAAVGILMVFRFLRETIMATRTFHTTTPLEALLVEQALLLARQLQQTATAARDGQVLAQVEAVAMAAGRDFTRRAVAAALQAQAAPVEQKGVRGGGAPDVPGPGGPKGTSPAT